MRLRFNLTLLSAFVLTACSSGGNGGHHTPQAETPKVNQQSRLKVEEESQLKAEEKSQLKAEEKSQPKAEEKSQPKAEEKPQSKAEEKPQPKAEEKPQPKAEEKSQPKAEEKSQPKAEEKSQPKAEEKSQPKAEEKSQPKVEEKSQPKIEEMLQLNIDNNPNMQVTDTDIFRHLNQYGNDYNGSRFIKLNLEGKKITLSPISNKIDINHKDLEILRDNTGKLIGYYGYASVTEQNPRYYGSEELIAHHSFIPLVSIDQRVKAVEPTRSINYYGKMYYHYVNVPAQVLGANVVANYNHQDKRFSMLISDDQLTWELRETPSKRNVSFNNDTDSQDNISGRLYIGNQPKGEFIGGIYGSQGEILVGKANSIAEQGAEAWKGVVGAKAKDSKE